MSTVVFPAGAYVERIVYVCNVSDSIRGPDAEKRFALTQVEHRSLVFAFFWVRDCPAEVTNAVLHSKLDVVTTKLLASAVFCVMLFVESSDQR